MDYSIGAAIGAGLIATAIMTALLYMGRAMMPKQMTMDILYMLGSMMTPSKMPAYAIGAMVHVGMGIVWAIIHTAIYNAFGLESALAAWGILFGAVHWVVVGMGMGMAGMMHPLMKKGELADPGMFVKNSPMMTRVGFFMLHLQFGLIVGVFNSVFT